MNKNINANTAAEPRTHVPDDPGCPCRDCQLEAEADDATWD